MKFESDYFKKLYASEHFEFFLSILDDKFILKSHSLKEFEGCAATFCNLKEDCDNCPLDKNELCVSHKEPFSIIEKDIITAKILYPEYFI